MIRYARPADHAAIDAVVSAAFGQADEARLVARLRADGDALFEMVAEQAGEVVGHVMFSRLWADRDEMFAALAPLAVRPEAQRAGLGSGLVRAGLEMAKEFGAHGVLVLGDPAFYPRFGFSAAAAAQVSAPYAGQPAFMALALEPGAFDAPVSVAYPDAFVG
ncbi:N-acetyltransferase [Phenylobacterium hankyongense]|uniref:N-acetyltransferase n=1 Tax=Phenylobacterium hankyongense TaxID=1813876 RepID=A0A328B211_9CAUL|nr:N-acetyltransferase [Phenylobacterium hankyongense]RAK60491.1 N-acetyltransferase [Phenylobacterium hankyongense]